MLTLVLLAIAALAADPEDLLVEARRRAVVGDFEGARIIATQAQGQSADHDAEARYLIALSLEHEGRPEEALPIYDELLGELTDPARRDDVHFRKAEALGRAHRYTEAIAELNELGDAAARTPGDTVKLQLLRGLWEIELPGARNERAGIERIHRTLEHATALDAPHHQAQARTRLVELAIHQAETVAFRGRKRKKARRLEARAQLVTWSSEQIVPLIGLDSPASTLQVFALVGSGFESYGQAMLDESRVRGLNPDQRTIYLAERQARVEAVWVKASRYYDRGIQYAEVTGWEGPETSALRAALAAVVERVDGLAAADPPES